MAGRSHRATNRFSQSLGRADQLGVGLLSLRARGEIDCAGINLDLREAVPELTAKARRHKARQAFFLFSWCLRDLVVKYTGQAASPVLTSLTEPE